MYFFDSSVVIEMIKDSPKVVERFKSEPLLTINLAYGEVYYYCLRAQCPIEKFEKLTFKILDYSLEHIKSAMRLLYKRKQDIKDFSFVDALLYAVSKSMGCILVTKDYGFSGLDTVEVIKQ